MVHDIALSFYPSACYLLSTAFLGIYWLSLHYDLALHSGGKTRT